VDANAVAKAPNPAYRVWRGIEPTERDQRLQAVLHRYVNDEKLEHIAKDIGLSRSALNMALLEYAEGDWKRIQVARAMTRLDKANEELELASDMLTLSRAREGLRSAQWELERLLRRLYGQDAPANIQVPIQINIGIERTQNPTLEAQVIDKTE
jgi:hypothetical protein